MASRIINLDQIPDDNIKIFHNITPNSYNIAIIGEKNHSNKTITLIHNKKKQNIIYIKKPLIINKTTALVNIIDYNINFIVKKENQILSSVLIIDRVNNVKNCVFSVTLDKDSLLCRKINKNPINQYTKFKLHADNNPNFYENQEGYVDNIIDVIPEDENTIIRFAKLHENKNMLNKLDIVNDVNIGYFIAEYDGIFFGISYGIINNCIFTIFGSCNIGYNQYLSGILSAYCNCIANTELNITKNLIIGNNHKTNIHGGLCGIASWLDNIKLNIKGNIKINNNTSYVGIVSGCSVGIYNNILINVGKKIKIDDFMDKFGIVCGYIMPLKIMEKQYYNHELSSFPTDNNIGDDYFNIKFRLNKQQIDPIIKTLNRKYFITGNYYEYNDSSDIWHSNVPIDINNDSKNDNMNSIFNYIRKILNISDSNIYSTNIGQSSNNDIYSNGDTSSSESIYEITKNIEITNECNDYYTNMSKRNIIENGKYNIESDINVKDRINNTLNLLNDMTNRQNISKNNENDKNPTNYNSLSNITCDIADDIKNTNKILGFTQ